MTNEELNELEEWRLPAHAKKLAILLGYRTQVVRDVLSSPDKKTRDHNLARLRETQDEIKSLLKIT